MTKGVIKTKMSVKRWEEDRMKMDTIKGGRERLKS